MKPFIWMNKDHRAEFDGAKGDLGMTVSVWNDSLNQYAKSKDLKPMDVPLYTAEQLAEAVAAERERCVKACEGERLEDVASDPTDISYAVAVECCIHAIRSAAK